MRLKPKVNILHDHSISSSSVTRDFLFTCNLTRSLIPSISLETPQTAIITSSNLTMLPYYREHKFDHDPQTDKIPKSSKHSDKVKIGKKSGTLDTLKTNFTNAVHP